MKKTIFPLWAGLLVVVLLSSCAGYRAPPLADHTPPLADHTPPSGFYRVQRGDNLYRIGLKFRQSAATLARWNGLNDVNQLEVGQLLRVVPERGQAAAVPVQKAPTPRVTPPRKPTTDTPPPSSAVLKNLNLAWPASGRVLSGYDGSSNKGINIGGAHGSAVRAAADGDVVYASDQVRGYGRLVLLRHNKQVLTAYAHNSRLLVKVGQRVKKGDTVAYMGSADNGQTLLHFELRVNGRAVNPLPYLPPR